MSKILRICRGNTFALKIDVEKLHRRNGSIVKEDFDLTKCKQIRVSLASKGKSYFPKYDAVGKTLTIYGDKDFEVGMYDIELACVTEEEYDLLFSKPSIFSIVRNTEDADIPAGVEFGCDVFNLGVVAIYYAGGEGGGTGSVTSVGLTMPEGFEVVGSPIKTKGILSVDFAEGYSLPSNEKQAEWSAKQDALTGGENVTIEGNEINVDLSGCATEAEVGAMQEQIKLVAKAPKLTMTASVSIIEKGINTNLTIRSAFDEFCEIIEQYKNGSKSATTENVKAFTTNYLLNDTTAFTSRAVCKGLEFTASLNVTAVDCILYGFCASGSNPTKKMTPRTSALTTYEDTATANGQVFCIYVPNSGVNKPTKFSMGGAPASYTQGTKTIGSIPYTTFTSDATYNTGTKLTIKAE